MQAYEDIPLPFLFFSSWFGPSLWLSVHTPSMLLSVFHSHKLLSMHSYLYYANCLSQGVSVLSGYLQYIPNSLFLYNGNCLKFMSILGWFYLLMLLLPQVGYGQVQRFRVPDKQHSLSSAKSCCQKLVPSLPPPTNDYSLLLSLLQQRLLSLFSQAFLFPLTLPLSQGIITK